MGRDSSFSDDEKKLVKSYLGTVGDEIKNQAQARSLAIDKIIKEQVDRIKQDISTWRNAIDMAEDVDDPDPFELYQLYTDVLDDDQVHSTKQQRVSKAVNGKISLKNENNEIDEDATAKLIKPDGTPHPWFRDFLKICMESKFYGYSIAQFRPPVNGEFVFDTKTGSRPVESIPFENMIPRLRAVRLDINDSVQNEANRTPVYGGPYSEWLIACGCEKDLGLLNKLAPFWIFKKVFQSWTQHAKIFGMPFRKGNTNINDNARFQNMINMFENMSGATYFVGHEGDEVEITYPPTGGASGSDIYKSLIKECNKAIAKITLSQTGTTDEKSYAGSAEVHADVLSGISWGDKLDLAAVIDEQLLPFLKKVGVLPESAKVFSSWDIDEKVSLKDWANIIDILGRQFGLSAEEVSKKFNISLEEKEVNAMPGQAGTNRNTEVINNINRLYNKALNGKIDK